MLGLFSLPTLGVGGLVAVILGSMARKDIDASNGVLTGRALATTGIVTGLFGFGTAIVLALSVLSTALGPAEHAKKDPRPASTSPIGAGTRSYGTLEVVDLDDTKSLGPQLAEVALRGNMTGRTVILQTYVRSSRECAAVAASLPDIRMQKALANVTLVRVDIERFGEELRGMKVETASAPWFYTLDAHAKPTDAISAEAWGENIPENMAPALARFARHRRVR